jgi:hypothetical protein
MLGHNRRISALAAAAALGLGLAAVSVGTGQATSTNGPLTCGIEATTTGGAIALESRVQTEGALSGSYPFRVASAAHSGSTNFQQGGGMSAMPGGPVTLGRNMLGDASAIYDATLEIAADGTTVTCTRQVGGKI